MTVRPPKQRNSEKAARLAREAAALRANLLKRKAQTRERAEAGEPAAAPPKPCPARG
ncbi:MAG: hypothetical protein M0002_07760 [Rhodospirillales bacterium]|nr:hypothetical protein [Rhodospirillales bacterium]